MRVEQSFKWLKNGEKSREVNEFYCISTLLWFRFEILELQHRLNELPWRDASDVTSELRGLTLPVGGGRLEIMQSVPFFFFFAVRTQTSTSRLDRFVLAQPEQTQRFEFGCHAVFVVTF